MLDVILVYSAVLGNDGALMKSYGVLGIKPVLFLLLYFYFVLKAFNG
jgi:hypothetical protein